jgi:hypothetical protein
MIFGLTTRKLNSVSVAGQPEKPFGMNVPDSDNRQFTLIVMHWLSRLKDVGWATGQRLLGRGY